MASKIRIGATSGLRGWFPVEYDDEGPISTGFTCVDYKEAKEAAIDWAKAEWGRSWKNHCDYGGSENDTDD